MYLFFNSDFGDMFSSELLGKPVGKEMSKKESSQMQAKPIPVNIYKKEDCYEAVFSMQGFKAETVQVEVENGYLEVLAELKLGNDEGARGDLKHQEIFEGKFGRKITIPESVSKEKITARWNSGLLVVKMPISDSALNRKIAIEYIECPY